MKAYRDSVIVRERSDLDPGISDILLIPETAKRFTPSPEPDHLCYGEVVSIGQGSIEQPSIATLRVGDIVTYDLANVSHAYIQDGTGYQVVPQKALVEANGVALLDWVVTVQDEKAAGDAISKSVLVPGTIIADGQRTENFTKDGNMRIVYERVVSVGPGRRYRRRDIPDNDEKRLAYDDIRAPDTYKTCISIPECKAGDLIAFCPSAATRFRRGGKFHRAVPYEEVQFALDE